MRAQRHERNALSWLTVSFAAHGPQSSPTGLSFSPTQEPSGLADVPSLAIPSLRLLEALYDEHLLDRGSFLRFLVHQIETSNVGQLPFVLFLAEEYLGEFLLTEPLSARLVSACFSRLNSVRPFRPFRN
jgi:hypothetical protein